MTDLTKVFQVISFRLHVFFRREIYLIDESFYGDALYLKIWQKCICQINFPLRKAIPTIHHSFILK